VYEFGGNQSIIFLGVGNPSFNSATKKSVILLEMLLDHLKIKNSRKKVQF